MCTCTSRISQCDQRIGLSELVRDAIQNQIGVHLDTIGSGEFTHMVTDYREPDHGYRDGSDRPQAY